MSNSNIPYKALLFIDTTKFSYTIPCTNINVANKIENKLF